MKKLLTSFIALLAFTQSHSAPITYTGDDTHDFNGTAEKIIAEDSVTVNILDSAAITNDGFNLYDQSHGNVSGGTIDGDMTLYDNSTGHVSGGEIDTNIRAYDQSSVVMTGGVAGVGCCNLENHGTGLIEVYGGTVGHNLVATSGSIVVYGGFIGVDVLVGWGRFDDEGEYLYDSASISFHGGQIGDDVSFGENGSFYMDGGALEGSIKLDGSSQATLVGVFDQPYGVYEMGSLLDDAILTGTLADGSAFSNVLKWFDDADLATLTLAAPKSVPEPATLALLGLGLVGLSFLRPQKA